MLPVRERCLCWSGWSLACVVCAPASEGSLSPLWRCCLRPMPPCWSFFCCVVWTAMLPVRVLQLLLLPTLLLPSPSCFSGWILLEMLLQRCRPSSACVLLTLPSLAPCYRVWLLLLLLLHHHHHHHL